MKVQGTIWVQRTQPATAPFRIRWHMFRRTYPAGNTSDDNDRIVKSERLNWGKLSVLKAGMLYGSCLLDLSGMA